MEIGDDIPAEIGNALNNAEFHLIILTPDSVKSKWCLEELNTIHGKNFERESTQIIPILKEACVLPPLLKSKLYADFTQDFATGLIPLLRRLGTGKPRVYKEHTSVQTHLQEMFSHNMAEVNSKAYFFQYSAVEIRPVLKQAVVSGYEAIVFIQDPECVPISRQQQRIEVSLDAIRQIDNITRNPSIDSIKRVKVYQVSTPMTAKLVYVPNLFIALSYYIYLNPAAAPPSSNDQNILQKEDNSSLGQYDVSGHDNPVILILAGEEGWKCWSDFAIQLHERYLEYSKLLHPS